MIYRMYASVRGQMTKGDSFGSVPLSGKELAVFEGIINDSFHRLSLNTLKTRLLPQNADRELDRKLESLDLSACMDEETGNMTACFTIVSKGSLTELEKAGIESGIFHNVMAGWGHSLLNQEIKTPQGDLAVWQEGMISPALEWQPKYEITEQAHPKYPWLHRIRALVDIKDHVMEGDYGGFVGSMENLSHDGGCWIYENSISCDGALVEGEAKLAGNAVARDRAVIGGTAMLLGQAVAEGNCHISNGRIQEDARIAGGALISGQEVECGKEMAVRYPHIKGKSNVYGNVSGGFVIMGNVMPHENLINQTPDVFILQHGVWEVAVEPKKLKPPQGIPCNKPQKQDREQQGKGECR